MKQDTFLTPSGVVVLVQWGDGTCGSRSVPWADLKSAGDTALIEACNIVKREVGDARVVAVSRGHGNIFHKVSVTSTYELGANLDRFQV
jgi:hypothetical protein